MDNRQASNQTVPVNTEWVNRKTGFRGRGSAYQEYLTEIARMRGERLTYREIGEALNVSRQRVEQICKQHSIYAGPPGPPKQKWPVPGFADRMRTALWEAGYRRCICGLWSEKVTKSIRRCPKCNAARTNAYYRTPKGRAYYTKYRKDHPEVAKAATQKYLDKLRSTPEGRARISAWARAAYEKARSKA